MENAFKLEVDAVKQLGDKIGYGNMMAIASALWLEDMRKNGYPTSGVFIPVLQSDIKPELKGFYIKEANRMDNLVTPSPTAQNP